MHQGTHSAPGHTRVHAFSLRRMCSPGGTGAQLGVRCNRRTASGPSTPGVHDPGTYDVATSPWVRATLSACTILSVFASLSVHDLWHTEDPRCKCFIDMRGAPNERRRFVPLIRLSAHSVMDALIRSVAYLDAYTWLV